MEIEKLNSSLSIKNALKTLGVDDGGINILSQKADIHIIHIKNLHVGGANILKQDALSIGADLAVPRGTVIALTPEVDCILIATTAHLRVLSKKEKSQPFGLKALASYIEMMLRVQKPKNTSIMGVINANTDSFFAGSRFLASEAIQLIHTMIDDGVSIIDIGAVSSAPNSASVDAKEELSRIKPILELIKEQKLYEKVEFCIDS